MESPARNNYFNSYLFKNTTMLNNSVSIVVNGEETESDVASLIIEGRVISADLILVGINSVNDLKGKDPAALNLLFISDTRQSA